MTCKQHTHSSERTARRCFERRIQKRVDARIKARVFGAPLYEQIRHQPPKRLELNGIEIFVFFDAIPAPV